MSEISKEAWEIGNRIARKWYTHSGLAEEIATALQAEMDVAKSWQERATKEGMESAWRLRYDEAARTLGRQIAALTAQRDALQRDMDLLFGPGWKETLKAVHGQPHDFSPAQVTKLTGDLLDLTSQRDALRRVLEPFAAYVATLDAQSVPDRVPLTYNRLAPLGIHPTAGDCRAAKAAITPPAAPQKETTNDV